jgi:hypothetical protein
LGAPVKLLIDDAICIECGDVETVALCDYCFETRCDVCARRNGCPLTCVPQWEPYMREEAA